MTEQPAEPASTDPAAMDADQLRRYRRTQASYRLAVSLVTARDDRALIRETIQLASNDMPQANVDDITEIARMFACACTMLTEYVRAAAKSIDQLSGEPECFDTSFRATIRHGLLGGD